MTPRSLSLNETSWWIGVLISSHHLGPVKSGRSKVGTMIARIKQSVAGLVMLALVVAVLLFAGSMSPVRQGNSAGFWEHACGVNLAGHDKETMGGVYQPRDGWYIYYIQGYHGQFLFRVPRKQAVADFPEIVRRIKVLSSEKDALPRVRLATAVLEQDRSSSEDAERFLSLIHAERLRALRNGDRSLYDYAISEDQAFAERWVRARRYWANIVFECMYFVALTVFTLWPWLRSTRSVWSWSLHLGSLPVQLMLPYYCGYASWTFTSAGPSGGVLYPWVIVLFRGFPLWTSADQWVLEKFPKVLEPLSQPLGSMLVISGGRPLGPVAAVALGAGVSGLVFLGFKCIARKTRLKIVPAGDGASTTDHTVAKAAE
jgi:hypothetical protein